MCHGRCLACIHSGLSCKCSERFAKMYSQQLGGDGLRLDSGRPTCSGHQAWNYPAPWSSCRQSGLAWLSHSHRRLGLLSLPAQLSSRWHLPSRHPIAAPKEHTWQLRQLVRKVLPRSSSHRSRVRASSHGHALLEERPHCVQSAFRCCLRTEWTLGRLAVSALVGVRSNSVETAGREKDDMSKQMGA